MVGFDMDYTLALYNQAKIEELSMRATLHKLVTTKGYPDEIRAWPTTRCWRIRGLVVDRVQRQHLQARPLRLPRARPPRPDADRSRRKISELYQRERMRLSNRRYAWIDSLFALPEAVLYACLVDYFDRTARPGSPSTTSSGSISASASTSPTATARSRPSSARSWPTTSSAIPGWPRRCTSSARRASGCSC